MPVQQTQSFYASPQVPIKRKRFVLLGVSCGVLAIGFLIYQVGLHKVWGSTPHEAAKLIRKEMTEAEVIGWLGQPGEKIAGPMGKEMWIYPERGGELRIALYDGVVGDLRPFTFEPEGVWQRVYEGMSRADVVSILGQPDFDSSSGRTELPGFEFLFYGKGEVRLKESLTMRVCPDGCGDGGESWMERGSEGNARVPVSRGDVPDLRHNPPPK